MNKNSILSMFSKYVNLHIFLILFPLCLISLTSNAQRETINILPLSPNAAEFTKYGEIPVENFTGIPTINIPLYTIKSRELTLPLSLSYHAGGNKVEAIASWVGLSWSLNSLPVITRAVNGIPDEKAGGFFSSYRGHTVRELNEMAANGQNQDLYQFLSFVREQETDPEPDTFYFNTGEASGRFYYDQDKKEIVVTPLSNVKVSYSGLGFTIISDDGSQYIFEDQEVTGTTGSSKLSSSTTSWMITKIINATKTDTISFTYDIENIATRSLGGAVKYQYVSGVVCEGGGLRSSSGGVLTTVNTKSLASIKFKGGRVNFTKKALQREDLNGGYALDMMKVYNSNNTLIKQFAFDFKYIGNNDLQGCIANDAYRSNKWMLLNQLKEISVDNSQIFTHTFQYDESVPPCRNSAAQDYWGYYNGQTSNEDLVPTMIIPNTNGIVIPGANREVNPSYSQYGIIKKITYPSGGFTEFDFENNDAQNSGLNPFYSTQMAYVADESWEQLPSYNEYTTTFSINNAPDNVLNGGNPNGGAYVTGTIENLGVPFGSMGASIHIKGISGTNSTFNLYPSGSFANFHFPNGTYKITAVFNQDPPNYQGFSCIVNWDVLDSSKVIGNKFVGGLRIKELRSSSNVNSTPITKKYFYTKGIDSKASSGDVFVQPNFKYYDHVIQAPGDDGSQSYYCTAMWMRMRSYSNQSQVTHSGSYVGYNKVFIENGNSKKTGISCYEYTNVKDAEYNIFPYPPAQSMESSRGQLKSLTEYHYNNDKYNIAKQSTFDYKGITLENEMIYAFKVSSEAYLERDEFNFIPYFVSYEIPRSWSKIEKETERLYQLGDTTKFVEKIINYEYDQPYNQLINTKTLNSRGQTLENKLYYPYNLTLSGESESARNWLISHNSISKVIKEENIVNNQKAISTLTNFKNFDNINNIRRRQIIKIYTDTVANNNVIFDKYDQFGNLLQFHYEKGINICYIWGYESLYPIFEIKNVDYSVINTILNNEAITRLNRPEVNKSTIDEIRGMLVAALPSNEIISNSYKPLVGLLSSTDAKGLVTYFEYDEFQRLKNLKDQQGNIIKNYTYHYKN